MSFFGTGCILSVYFAAIIVLCEAKVVLNTMKFSIYLLPKTCGPLDLNI